MAEIVNKYQTQLRGITVILVIRIRSTISDPRYFREGGGERGKLSETRQETHSGIYLSLVHTNLWVFDPDFFSLLSSSNLNKFRLKF